GAQVGNRHMLRLCLGLTLVFGAAFLVIKGFEYYVDYHDNLLPLVAFDDAEWISAGLQPRRAELFLVIYYFMTGLHALHLVIGLGILTTLLVLADRYSPLYHTPVEVGGLYWHFVDVVWVFLLPLLYLTHGR